jgi:uncharacterized protein (DUF2336 family)
MGPAAALIRELHDKAGQISADRRATALRRLTDYFIVGSEHFSSEDIATFDTLFVLLADAIEESARALLAIRLAPIVTAPPKVMKLLASDNIIDIASPVLRQSAALDDATLIECAMTKSQEHLLAVSQRKMLSEAVTDVLVKHGDQDVVLSTAMNVGARFSSNGFDLLVEHAGKNDTLAGCVGRRSDLPSAMFEKLLSVASETVREKLKIENHHTSRDIDYAVNDVTSRISKEATRQTPQKAAAHVLIESLSRAGQLNDVKIKEFAKSDRLDDVIVALALMVSAPTRVIMDMLRDSDSELILILTKAGDLSWETTKAIIACAKYDRPLSERQIEHFRIKYQNLVQTTARKIIDFRCARARSAQMH